ncbi:AAA domain-containing protein [Lentinula aciculospora]|uniref:AAA domain-containing protein n=1 Tax=Lentinula aciculospora TaxID=153920 RepID=A0A9W8ZZC6_9AGAR|nr:AAA domain-containing protein [Lentinula aciculospora]
MAAVSQSTISPPLIGDNGRYRIRIIGNSGSGKSTLSRQLASILDIPCLSLDEIFWQPGWKPAPDEEFHDKVIVYMQKNELRGWIIDGDFTRVVGAIVHENATDVIWLNPPLLLYFPRLVYRTFCRLIGLERQCSDGCPETVRKVFFSKDSILLWCLSQHWVQIERNSALMKIWGLGKGTKPPEEQKMRRLGGWGSEVEDWLENIRKLVKNT